MHKLIDEKGKVLFESHFEMAGDNITLSDNSFYRFITCAECCDLVAKVYKNDRLIKSLDIKVGETKSFSFRTGVSDKYDFRFTKDCFSTSQIVAKFVTVPQTCKSLGNINLTVSGGQAPYTYLWSNGATTPIIIGN